MNLHLHFCKEKLDLLPDCNFSSHAIFHICYILKSINVKCMFTNQFLENFFTINWITCIRWAKNNLCDFKLYAPVPAFRKPFICVFTTNCVYTCTLTSSRLFSFFFNCKYNCKSSFIFRRLFPRFRYHAFEKLVGL